MDDLPGVNIAITLRAGEIEPKFSLDYGANLHSVRLTGSSGLHSIDLDGTLDELAAFVQSLANVVRELSERELDATSAPVSA